MNGIRTNGSRITPLAVASGAIASFDAQVAAPLKILKADINPVQAGSGDPYPPGGGNNKWDEEYVEGTIDHTTGEYVASGTSIASKNFIPISGDTAYYAVITTWYKRVFYDSNYDYILGYQDSNRLFTTPVNAAYMKFATNGAYGTTYNHDIAINYPSTVTTYSPYSNIRPISGWDSVNVSNNGQTTEITLPRTVYGGKLDMLSGVGIENKGRVVFDGNEAEEWTNYGAENGFYISIPNMKSGTSLAGISNWLKTISATVNFGIRFGRSNTTVYCCHITDNIPGVMDLASWKTYLASHNLEVIYPLSTPAEFITDPINMNSRAGSNEITTDSGNTTACYLKGVTT